MQVRNFERYIPLIRLARQVVEVGGKLGGPTMKQDRTEFVQHFY